MKQMALAAHSDERTNITVVLPPEGFGDGLEELGVTEVQLYALGCAVIRARVVQMDATNKILLLSDERVLAFDSAHLA